MENLALWQGALQQRQTETALQKVNRRVAGHGLVLAEEEIRALAIRHGQVLRDTGRIEFGQGILPKLAFAFCDSPYIPQAQYAATLAELLECFYYFKGETLEAVGDDDLLAHMKKSFDGECHGSVEYLRETVLEALAHGVRFAGLAEEAPGEDAWEEDADAEE